MRHNTDLYSVLGAPGGAAVTGEGATAGGPARPGVAAVLGDRFGGRTDTEANYHRVMYYLTDALWISGRGTQALAALRDLLGDERLR